MKMSLRWLLPAIATLTISGTVQGSIGGPALYQITDPVTHAECPSWDSRNNLLYYVDVHAGTIYSYNFTDNAIASITLSGAVSPVVQSKSNPNLFIVGLDRSIVAVEWNREEGSFSSKTLATVSDDKIDSNFNDGKADKQGRIWFGTMDQDADTTNHPDRGRLFRVTRDLVPEVVIAPVNVSNGMAWNKANDKFYYIDSPSLQIAEYDYDDETGDISNRRVAFDLAQHDLNASPDGMTIDVEDNLWVALYGGGSVIKVNPTTGELVDRFPIPAEAVTSVMWGGPDLDILFITTSRIGLSDQQIMQQPGAGSVFALTNLNTTGLPVFEADIVDYV